MSNASSPAVIVPKNACDCHAHVFGPFDRFPLAEDRPYTPPVTTKESYFEMLRTAGIARGVLVHGGASGWNQGALIEALRSAPDQLRGVAVPRPEITDSELSELHAAGVRGVRFTHVAGPSLARRYDGRLDLVDLDRWAPRLRELGWHAQIWANCDVIEQHQSKLCSYEIPLVIDHLGYFDVTRGVQDSAFQTLAQLLADGYVWVKLTSFRNSRQGAAYEDVRPFHDTLVAANSDQLLWGSDWPFLGMTGDRVPTVAGLLEQLGRWIPDARVRTQILCHNPARLYGFQ
ncbi:MAG: amidohydrolase family protein [Steroidobacteraceae bacterium]|jgi:predicted TIM-barrel fold metal-dependent hydrolase